MPSVQARRLCPHAVFLAGRPRPLRRGQPAGHGDLHVVHAAGRADLARRGLPRRAGRPAPARRRPDDRRKIRGAVLDEEGLTCSVGVAPVQVRRQAGVRGGQARRRRRRGPARRSGSVVVARRGARLPPPAAGAGAVGGRARRRSSSSSASASTRSATWRPSTRGPLIAALGAASGAPPARAWPTGIDDRAVDARAAGQVDRPRGDLRPGPPRLDTLQRELVRLGDSVAPGCGPTGWPGARSRSRCGSTTSARSPGRRPCRRRRHGPRVVRAATELLADVDPPGVRLHRGERQRAGGRRPDQLSLGRPVRAWDDANRAVDAIRARFGADAIGPASLAGPGGIRVKKRATSSGGPRPGTDQRAGRGDRRGTRC